MLVAFCEACAVSCICWLRIGALFTWRVRLLAWNVVHVFGLWAYLLLLLLLGCFYLAVAFCEACAVSCMLAVYYCLLAWVHFSPGGCG